MTTTTSRSVGLRSDRGPVLAAIMLCTGLVAIDSTIIATAVPSMVSDLGGFSQFPWLFSIYLLTQAVTVPLYGKLADTFGRKPVMFFGIAAFLLGSALCGFAWSMPALIAFRAIQGIGAGAIQPMSVTMVGDLYSLEERARVQGYVASVWGVSAVIGPTLGGVFSEYVNWRWIFFINLPLGAVAVWALATRFKERVERSSHRVDYLGATLLTAGSSLLILGLLEGDVAWSWTSAPSLVIFAAGILFIAAFLLVERRAAEPILPLWVFRRRTLVGGNLVGLCIGALMIGLSSYVPTFAQGVLGTGALVAGFVLAALSVGWPLAATFSGRLYMRIGFRDTAFIGGGLALAGAVLCALLGSRAPLWQVAVACFIVGAGLGLLSSPAIVAVQSSVGWERRGVVTATNMFCRSIGSSVGAAVLGAISNGTLNDRFSHPPAAVAGEMPNSLDATALVLGSQGSGTSPGAAAYVRQALYDASHHVFLAVVVVAVLAVGALVLLPRRAEELSFD
ncbi:MDR family MFS transporter [Sphaerisporangium krabiense]|uniref:EmrB/QacA subfamily drug resistance transporter n=1 Tax=Sphaerisporangium krabiense TaxID=763782 RepID=A0A7W9DNU3_9ACTN|nr:MDR family MFS transporter [Sphaerisporangium krabiense]MBB5625718.1 EmrB/QacA subfamily drug resistance transporter [Sphaerisporangium krabiense]